MAAKDYTFCEGVLEIYLAKKSRCGETMSKDRRPLEEQEQVYIAEHFLRRFCKQMNTDTCKITNHGKPIMLMVLLDKDEEDNSNK